MNAQDTNALCDFEYRVLAMLDGRGPVIPWGAAVGAALGLLKGSGYVALEMRVHDTATYVITARGRQALDARGAR